MSDRPSPARSFGLAADAYDRGRPSYPRDAVVWATSAEPLTVLELGAGTGRLTEHLVALGHDVHATDPDPAMLELLRRRLPGVRTSATAAEDVPAADRSYDVVVAAQAFHLFQADRALAEVARVLKPGGHLAVLDNVRDERIPWVRKLGRALASAPRTGLGATSEVLGASALVGEPETHSSKHWQGVDRRSLLDLVASRLDVIALPEEERQARLEAVRALYDDYGRGMDGMQLPYVTHALRARVADRPEPAPTPRDTAETGEVRGEHEPTVPIAPPTDDDSGMLLIDFR